MVARVRGVVVDGVLAEGRLLSAVRAVEVDAKAADFAIGRGPDFGFVVAVGRLCVDRQIGEHALVVVRLVRVDFDRGVRAKGGFAAGGVDHPREECVGGRNIDCDRRSDGFRRRGCGGRRWIFLSEEERVEKLAGARADLRHRVARRIREEDEAEVFFGDEADQGADAVGAAVVLDDAQAVPVVDGPAESVRRGRIDGDQRRRQLAEQCRRDELGGRRR